MCGIFCEIIILNSQPCELQDPSFAPKYDNSTSISTFDSYLAPDLSAESFQCIESIKRRGPDLFQLQQILIGNVLVVLFVSVLHLQGDAAVRQPIQSSCGDILCWNGEVYDWVDSSTPLSNSKSHVSNDAQMISNYLDVVDESEWRAKFIIAMEKITGPFAFIYFRKSTRNLYFGRDYFGRRSLLISTDGSHSSLSLSSVVSENGTWNNTSTDGIFRIRLDLIKNATDFAIDSFKWRQGCDYLHRELITQFRDSCPKCELAELGI